MSCPLPLPLCASVPYQVIIELDGLEGRDGGLVLACLQTQPEVNVLFKTIIPNGLALDIKEK
jgi:hypothetical protein